MKRPYPVLATPSLYAVVAALNALYPLGYRVVGFEELGKLLDVMSRERDDGIPAPHSLFVVANTIYYLRIAGEQVWNGTPVNSLRHLIAYAKQLDA